MYYLKWNSKCRSKKNFFLLLAEHKKGTGKLKLLTDSVVLEIWNDKECIKKVQIICCHTIYAAEQYYKKYEEYCKEYFAKKQSNPCENCCGSGEVRANHSENGKYTFHKVKCHKCFGIGFEMPPPKRKIYRCNYCKMQSTDKTEMDKHIKQCRKKKLSTN